MKKLLVFLSFVLTAVTVSAQSIRKGDANNDNTVDSSIEGVGSIRWIIIECV